MGHLGPGLTLGFKTSPQGVDWPTLDATWALAGSLDLFAAGWVNDHLTDPSRERGGASFEPLTLLGALAHHVPGTWLGVAVLANTFRHPAVLAKEATVLDNVTGGRFILGLGSGWHGGEHAAFGIPLPPLRERFDRYESTLRVLTALFSAEARGGRGVTLDDPTWPLLEATNEPPPVRQGGPAIWLGGQKARGIALAARYAVGWPMPGDRAGDVDYFVAKRDELRRALEGAGRDPAGFTFAGQVACGTTPAERAAARETGLRFVAVGVDHLILAIPARGGPDALAAMAREVAEPIREAAG